MIVLCCCIFSAIILLCSCQKKEISIPLPPDKSVAFSIYLTDAPAAYKALLIDVQQILVKASDSINSGWIEIPLVRTGQYNVLDFRNGKDTLLAYSKIPSGTLTQIRLVLGSNNQLILNDGKLVPLNLPSSQQSGIKLTLQENLKPGKPFGLVLDFDALQSIHNIGGEWLFNPVFRTFSKASNGGIEGIALPDSAKIQVLAIMGSDTLGTIPDSTGYYKFQGLSEGMYKLFFVAGAATGYSTKILDSISVTDSSVRSIDTVRLNSSFPHLPF